jgi:flagellar biosynthesis GTPase FlhF
MRRSQTGAIHSCLQRLIVPRFYPPPFRRQALFDAAPIEVRLQAVREEMMVIALERYALPHVAHAIERDCKHLGDTRMQGIGGIEEEEEEGGEEPYRTEDDRDDPADYVTPRELQQMCTRALSRICTSLTRGGFREFAIEHYPQLKWIDVDLMERLRTLWRRVEEGNGRQHLAILELDKPHRKFKPVKNHDAYYTARALVHHLLDPILPRAILLNLVMPYLEVEVASSSEEEEEREEEEEPSSSSSEEEEQEEQEEQEQEEEQEEEVKDKKPDEKEKPDEDEDGDDEDEDKVATPMEIA